MKIFLLNLSIPLLVFALLLVLAIQNAAATQPGLSATGLQPSAPVTGLVVSRD